MPTPQQSGDKKPDRLQGQGNAIEAILAQVGDKSANELTFGTAEGEIDLTETNLTENQIRRYAELKQLVKETIEPAINAVDLPDCRGDDYKNAYREYRNTLETKIDDSLGKLKAEVEQALYHCNFFRAVPMENSRLSDTHLARPSDKPAGINEINA
ncbi:472_t:CDS:2 [Entrophospora sp. SA101]|nr:472_t:CDS:2 [Entrophospora sp. SA101]